MIKIVKLIVYLVYRSGKPQLPEVASFQEYILDIVAVYLKVVYLSSNLIGCQLSFAAPFCWRWNWLRELNVLATYILYTDDKRVIKS